MDDYGSNIEDFFNKSMGQFKGEPSQDVWANIHQRLENEQPPFYLQWWFLGALGSLLLTFFLLSGWHWYSQKDKELLNLRIQQLEEENAQLKQNLAQQNELLSIAYWRDSLELVASTKKPFNPPPMTSSLHISHSTKTNFSKPLQTIIQQNSMKKKEVTTAISNAKQTNSNVVFPEQPLTTQSQTTTSNPITHHSSKGSSLKAIKPSKTIGNQSFSLQSLPILKTQQIQAAGFSTPSNGVPIKPSPMNLLPEKPQIMTPSYRLGITGGITHTLTDQEDRLMVGHTAGITSELRLSNQLYFTAGVTYNTLNYKIKLYSSSQQLVVDYPKGTELLLPVTQIKQHVHYLDVPLGLKWYCKQYENGNKWFIQPSIGLQLYFPQTFTYELTSTEEVVALGNVTEPHFHYLGTTQLYIGFEKALSSKVAWQLGVWGQRPWSKFGVEKRQIGTIGVRANLLLAPNSTHIK